MKTKKNFIISISFLLAFVVWTVLVKFVDVQSIGPMNSSVGFATLNGAFRSLVGSRLGLYTVTDWLSIVPLVFVLGFAVLGAVQLITRKSLKKVDYDLFVLGGFYIVVFALYVAFEFVVINQRPVLLGGILETSYPSSTTLLVLTVIPTAYMQLNARIKDQKAKNFISILLEAFLIFMVLGRIISGVHWITDIIGGALLSVGLVMAYKGFISLKKTKGNK